MVRFSDGPTPGHSTLVGSTLAPYPGEIICGDSWAWRDTPSGRTVLLADGLGHGVEAARAADTAKRLFQDHAAEPCEQLMERMHRALGSTRGAALAIARIDAETRVVRFVGVGNISAALVSAGKTRRMVSHNGTAGYVAPRIREFIYEYTDGPLIILHSDGLTSRWDLSAYPGLTTQHPSLVAGVLLRDHRRGRDDASVVAIRPTA